MKFAHGVDITKGDGTLNFVESKTVIQWKLTTDRETERVRTVEV
jgi:hypothetical protein